MSLSRGQGRGEHHTQASRLEFEYDFILVVFLEDRHFLRFDFSKYRSAKMRKSIKFHLLMYLFE